MDIDRERAGRYHARYSNQGIDGVRIHNLQDFRVQSPAMSVTYPEDNVIQLVLSFLTVPKGTHNPNVSDGYFLIIAPLSKGTHTIRQNGEVVYRLTIR